MTSAYQGSLNTTYAPQPVAAPLNQPQSSGCQQAASQAVISNDAAVTATLPYQPIGSTAAPVAGAFVIWDGSVP